MDITFSNVLEGARQYFQGLPSPASSSSQQAPQAGSSVNELASTNNSPRYSNPDSAPVGSTPPHYDNVVHRPSSQQPASAPPLTLQQAVTTVASSASSTVLSYWPPPQVSANSVYQRTKDVSAPGPSPSQVQHLYVPSKISGSSTAQNASHTVYNGSRLTMSEARTMNYQNQNHLQQQQPPQQQQQQQNRPQGHNLPPIAALPNYHSSRSSRDSTHRLSQHQQHMPTATLQTQQISSKIALPNSASLLRTQSEYNTQALQNQQNHSSQYSGANSGNSAIGSVSSGTIQYGLHRNQKYQQQIGSTPPASYSNYTSSQPQQTAATSISSSSSASASSSIYQSSLHHSQQTQQQYTYHLPHHAQGNSSLSVQPEIHMKPEHSSKRQYSSHQNYYNPSATGRPQPSAITSLSTNILTNGHQRSLPPSSSTASAIRNGRNKRESPLDLSVKTVRQSADSTAKDDMESNYSISSYSPASVEHQPRGKTVVAAIRSRTPQQTPVLPPLQLPSSVAYPTFDTRGRPSSSNTPASATASTTPSPSVGAPKVDFLPNFGSSSQHSSTAANNCVTDSQRPSGRTNPVHHQLYSQPAGTTLPHVGSFRKSSSTTMNTIPGSYEHKQATYYATTPISQTQHRNSNANSSSASTMLPPYSTSSSNHYPSVYEKRMPDSMQNYGTNRLDFQSQGSSQNSAAYMTSSATIGQKRGSSETRHPSPAKVPRLDKWKQTIDQQIEQRFSSYTSSRAQQQQQQQQHHHHNHHHQQQHHQHLQSSQQQVNGSLDSSRHETQYSHHHVVHHPSQQPNLQHHPRATAPAAVTATNQPQHGYPQAVPYVPSHGHQQYQTAHVGSQPMTQQQPPPRNHALQRLLTNPATLQSQQSLNRTITAATAGGMADKRVLSILRNSLEIKEARMTELQNQLQQNRQNALQQHHQHQQQQHQHQQQAVQVHQQNHQAGNQYHQIGQQTNHQQLPLSDTSIQILTQRKPSPARQLSGRHNLPPFPIAMDSNAQIATQVPAHKIHVPKAVESVLFDVEADRLTPRVSSAQNIGRTEVSETNHGSISVNNSNSNSGDPDGIAAMLAARIRTKAELKQVGPSLEQLSNSQQQQFQCPTPASSIVSASNSTVHSPRTTPGTPVVFSPPPHPMQTAVDVGENILSPINESTKDTERTPPSHAGIQHNQSAQSGSGASSSGSPPKLTRERVQFPPRRRLFSRPDEEPGGANGSGVIAGGSGSLVPPRDSSGLRSSSETSVFDFRDSDSEGEMPVLEMQTLDEMRRDRKSHTKIQVQASSTSVSEVIELAEDAVVGTTTASETAKPMEHRPVSPFDPFFSDTCDKFLEQLRTGDLKRKVRRKKTVAELKVIPNKIDNRSEIIEVKVDNVVGNEVNIEKFDQIKVEKVEENEDKTTEEKEAEKIDIKKPEKSMEKSSEKKEQVSEKIIEKLERKEANKIKIEKKKVDKYVNKENDKSVNRESDKIVDKEKKPKLIDSDEDIPLIRRRGRPRKKDSDVDVEDEISLAEIKARLGKTEKSAPVEVSRRARSRSTSSSSNTSSIVSSEEEDGDDDDSDSHEETVAERLRRRKRQGKDDAGSIGMRLRSKTPGTPQKISSNEKEKTESPGKSSSKKKKPQFGDGSDFRPGWEEEVYRFKRSLRMPARLINIPRPPHAHRLSASLPDLDPYTNSPAASTVDLLDFSPQRRNLSHPGGSLDRHHGVWSSVHSDLIDSDLDSSSNLSAPLNHGHRADDLIVDSEEATSSTTLSTKLKSNVNNDNNNSILNLLVRKYSKSPRKKSLEKSWLAGLSGSRTIPRSSDGPELLPTPSLGIGIRKSPSGKADSKKGNSLKQQKNKKGTKDNKDALCDIEDSVYLGYFRKKTVTNFRDAFLQNGGILPHNFAPIVYKSRTRTQTRVLRKRATIREVFGEDRPASAPPICQEEREMERTDKNDVKEKLVKEESGAVGKTQNNSNSGGRPGLRSAGLRRSNKALLNSKRRLLRRDHDLMRNLASKKVFSSQDNGKVSNEPVVILPQISRESSVTKASTTASPPPSSTSQQMEEGMVPPNGKRIKLRSVRRKFRSGFDYIRKKKKQQKKEGETEGPKDKKKGTFPRPSSESVQDIQAEIRGWVINKGLGETLLHRAARLGYTDVAAYCLEKLDNPPSPRDNAGYTPLHEACAKGHLEIARLLLMYGANVSDSALGGIRPLHEAAENGFTELIRLLLSYGADPLLATYSGYTPLSLATDDEARRLLQHHLADVQGLPAPPWTFQGPASCCDSPDSGYDPLSDPPSPSPDPPEDFEVEIESSELALPVLYRLRLEPPGERWVLLQDLTQVLRIKSRDALLRQLCAEAKSVMRELKMADFLEQARSCHLACGGEKINIRASKVALVRYNDKVKQLLGVEKVTIGGR